jgi:hypothetical protein
MIEFYKYLCNRAIAPPARTNHHAIIEEIGVSVDRLFANLDVKYWGYEYKRTLNPSSARYA